MKTVEGRPQSLGEEIANSLSHGVVLIAAIIAVPTLLVTTARHGGAVDVIGASVFSGTVVLLYFASCIYHAVPWQRAKAICRRLDHGAIFLMIAGTYTPFTLGVLQGPRGWTLFGLVWIVATVGIVLKARDRLAHPVCSLALYLIMGWLIVIAIDQLLERVPAEGLWLLGAGGFAYTAGVAFFATDSRVRYGHFVWHLFVVAGTACHFFAVLWYSAAPVAA
ncbi:MAG: hemolysin III family protein [Betaproteobacteria bacterium]